MSLQKRLQRSFDKVIDADKLKQSLVSQSPLVIQDADKSTPAQVTDPSDRRQFLSQSLLLGGGLALAVSFTGNRSVVAHSTRESGASTNESFTPSAFIEIVPNGAVKVIAMHDEMGQGTHTGLAMAVCEELEIAPSEVMVEHAPADVRYNHMAFGVQMTGGSTSMISARDAMRKAGATAREMLITAAANRWSVDRAKCFAKDGFIHNQGKKEKLAFSSLASDAAKLPVPKEVALKDPKNFTRIGKSTPRVDSASKTRGNAIFSLDRKVVGMLTAMVERCPYFDGKLVKLDGTAAQKVDGVLAVFEVPSGVAVLAKDYWAATKGRRELKIEWAPGRSSNIDTDELRTQYHQLAKQKARVAESIGDCEKSLEENETLEAIYEVPFQAHAPMEPLSCLVELKSNGGADVTTGSQFLGVDHLQVAARLGVEPTKVKVENSYLGGGFGRRANPKSDFVVEAVDVALASREAGFNKPVKTVWSREDDIRGGWYRPMYVNAMSAAIKDGKLDAWRHRVVGQSPIIGSAFESVIVVDGLDTWAVEGATKLPYDIVNKQVELQTVRLPIPVQWWRSVGHSNSGFAKEGFFDECAHKLGRDPLELRQELLKEHPRLLRVLNLAAEKADWTRKLPEGWGRGISVHESFQSFTSHVVEASVENGKPRIHRVVVAVDCGPTINPDQVVAQMEGATNFALSATLEGEITFKDGKVVQSNFNDFRVVRMHEAPTIEVHIVDSKDSMGGIGETGVAGVPSAVCSALFDACGKRIRRLPIGRQLRD